jgi:hypothetical protein
LLNAQKVRFVLAGAHGLAGWRDRARATEDIDLVVMAKHVKKATQLLSDAYPHLDAEDHEVVVRLRNSSTPAAARRSSKRRARHARTNGCSSEVVPPQGPRPVLRNRG